MKRYKIDLKNYIWLPEFNPKWKKKDKFLIIGTGSEIFLRDIIKRISKFLKVKDLIINEELKYRDGDFNSVIFITDDENNENHKKCIYKISKNKNLKKIYLIEKHFILIDITRHFKHKIKGERIINFGYVEKETFKSLYKLSRKIGENNSIIEIGTYTGGSTTALGIGSKDGNKNKVITIDPIMPDFIFEEISFLNLKELIIPVKGLSHIIAKNWKEKSKELNVPEKIGLIFLDGSHEYEYTLKDLNLWSNYIIKNGYIIIHDFYHPVLTGVSYASYKFLEERNDFKIIKKLKDSVICMKVK